MAAAEVIAPYSKHKLSYGSYESLPQFSDTSLVFDCELEDCEVSNEAIKSEGSAVLGKCDYRVRMPLPSGELSAKLYKIVSNFKWSSLQSDIQFDVYALASRFSSEGYSVRVRNAIGGGPLFFHNLKHKFLLVRSDSDTETGEIIVDPFFRDYFFISSPTDEYRGLLSIIPDAFVGTSSELVPLVKEICKQMSKSFNAKGMSIPPWRRAESMLTKWLPAKFKDIAYPATVEKMVEPKDHLNNREVFLLWA